MIVMSSLCMALRNLGRRSSAGWIMVSLKRQVAERQRRIARWLCQKPGQQLRQPKRYAPSRGDPSGLAAAAPGGCAKPSRELRPDAQQALPAQIALGWTFDPSAGLGCGSRGLGHSAWTRANRDSRISRLGGHYPGSVHTEPCRAVVLTRYSTTGSLGERPKQWLRPPSAHEQPAPVG